MGAFDSALCLKTSFLIWAKCVSNMSARHALPAFWPSGEHINSFRRGRDSGRSGRDLSSLHYSFTPNREVAAPRPGTRVWQQPPARQRRPDTTLPLTGTTFLPLLAIDTDFWEHKHEENNPEQTVCGRCHQGFWKCYHSTPRCPSLVQSLFAQHSRSKTREIVWKE